MKHSTMIKLLASCVLLSGCGAMDRISNIGKAPAMSTINNPVTQPGYQPVSLPMPAPQNVTRQKNSLWQPDRVTFFKDQRAANVGDIITVTINVNDKATIENETQRTRSSTENANLASFLGSQNKLNKYFPEAINDSTTGAINPDVVDLGADSNHDGKGTIDRKEEIDLRVAAIITQILPNGNMVVHGRQEMLVNYEKRILQIDGVIRPEDISVYNEISYDQVAEARIVYGGEGQLSDVQQPRYGQQLYDVIFPF